MGAVQAMASIESSTGVELPATVVFDSASVGAAHLHRRSLALHRPDPSSGDRNQNGRPIRLKWAESQGLGFGYAY